MQACFRSALPAALLPQADDPAVAALLDMRLREATDAWPDARTPVSEFVPFFASRMSESEPLRASIVRLRVADLFLIFACSRGDVHAIQAFHRRHLAIADRLVPRFPELRLCGDDVKQLLHERLLLPDATGRVKILDYRGEGKLESFVRVTTTRLLIALAGTHKQKRETPLEDALLDILVDPEESAEIAHLKETYRRELKEAFAAAVAALSDRQRNLLHYSYCDRLNLDAMGAMYGIHKSNVSRWIAEARTKLFDELRTAFQLRLQVTDSEYESIVRLVMSQIDLSLTRVLSTAGTVRA